MTHPKKSSAKKIKNTERNPSPAAPKATYVIQEDKSDAPDENNDPAVHKIPVHHPDISDQNETSNPPNENSDPTPHEITAHYSVVPETESPDDKEEKDPNPQETTGSDDSNPSETTDYGPVIDTAVEVDTLQNNENDADSPEIKKKYTRHD
jgi:hypothetical protein